MKAAKFLVVSVVLFVSAGCTVLSPHKVIKPTTYNAPPSNLAVPLTLVEAKKQAWTLQEFCYQKYIKIVGVENAFKNVRFVASVSGFVAGLDGDVDLVEWAVALAGAPDVFSNAYEVKTQADNYLGAAEAYECIFQKIRSSGLDNVHDPKAMGEIAMALDSVFKKLRTEQVNIARNPLDVDQLKQRLQDSLVADAEVEEKVKTEVSNLKNLVQSAKDQSGNAFTYNAQSIDKARSTSLAALTAEGILAQVQNNPEVLRKRYNALAKALVACASGYN